VNLEVGPNTRVYLNFSLSLETGEEVDSNFGAEPVSFVMGDGSLLPGFERRLLGMRSGEGAEYLVSPEEGFGERREDNLHSMPRTEFEADAQLEPGAMFVFADAAGGELPGVVAEVSADTVIVDFNHPLSGRTIRFKVLIARVEPAELH
jgi:FKBP-type peptidyl-prolyl cis-trans isomerase SlpA